MLYIYKYTCNISHVQYSDFTLDLEIASCLLLFHQTRFPLTKLQYPIVDIQLMKQLAQSTFKRPTMRL